jgi:hypothetical protein
MAMNFDMDKATFRKQTRSSRFTYDREALHAYSYERDLVELLEREVGPFRRDSVEEQLRTKPLRGTKY